MLGDREHLWNGRTDFRERSQSIRFQMGVVACLFDRTERTVSRRYPGDVRPAQTLPSLMASISPLAAGRTIWITAR